MFKKLLAIVTAVVLGAGLSLVAVAAPASAHTSALSGTAVCQADGTWKVTWTYDQTNTPGSGTGSETNVIVSATRTPVGSLVENSAGQWYLNAQLGSGTINGQTNVPTRQGNWSQQFVQTGIPGSATSATVTVDTAWIGWGTASKTTTVTFTGSCNNATPGEPLATPAQCVAGKAGLGSIWVKIVDGKLQYTIDNDPAFPDTPAAHVVVPNSGNGTTALPPGHYIVSVAPLGNTIIVTGQTVWPYKIEILPPVDCHQTEIAIPVSIKTDMKCEALSTIGYYTLPADDPRIEWWVGAVQKTGTQSVFVPGLVTVQARISPAAQALGVVFVGGGLTYDFPHLFVLPVPECDTTLALLTPIATQSNGSCTTAPTYILSNTTSSHGGVQWKVGDPQTNTTAGVHQATWGSTVKVEATLVNNVYDGFNSYPQKWTLIFPAKPTACGDLSTLALTGATGGFVPWIAGAMLLLGGAGIYFTRRRPAAQK